jgi:hypothetical protein
VERVLDAIPSLPVNKQQISFVIVGQVSRSLGMVTCGESFNHMIQKSKKNNHVLGGEHY